MLFAVAIPAAFLIGSIPFGLIIARRARGIDIREHGSGNIGATNVARVLGTRLGLICFALDVGKGIVPTLGAGIAAGVAGSVRIEPGVGWLWMATMASSILGHLFSPWLGFRGGKGVATGLGALLGVFPALTVPALGTLAVWTLVVWRWRYVGVASCAAAAALPGLVAMMFAAVGALDQSVPFVVATGVIAGIVIVKHRGNLVRTMRGTEPKFTLAGGGEAGASGGEGPGPH